jgi:hypothetical protein
VTTSPVIENLTALVDAVWAYSSRTLDEETPAASNGSYLDDIGYATWTYTERSVINPPPVPITAISAILLGGDGITTTRVVQLNCRGLDATYRRLLINGGGLAFPVAPVVTPTIDELNVRILPDVQFKHGPITFATNEIFTTPKNITAFSPKPGTLLHHLYWGQKQFLDGAQTSLFLTKDHNTQTYVRRTDTLAGAHDLSCISVWNSRFQERAGHTAITQRHCVCANHFAASVGDTVRFVDMQNQVFNRTISTRLDLYPFGANDDACLVTLDSDLPSSIVPAQFAPSDFHDYLTWYYPDKHFYNPQFWSELFLYAETAPQYLDYMVPTNYYPTLFRRQSNQLSAVTLTLENARPETVAILVLGWIPYGHVITEFIPLHQDIITYDSGGPGFAVVNGRVMLLGTAKGPGGGVSFHQYHAIYETQTGRDIEVTDLSIFEKQPTGFE